MHHPCLDKTISKSSSTSSAPSLSGQDALAESSSTSSAPSQSEDTDEVMPSTSTAPTTSEQLPRASGSQTIKDFFMKKFFSDAGSKVTTDEEKDSGQSLWREPDICSVHREDAQEEEERQPKRAKRGPGPAGKGKGKGKGKKPVIIPSEESESDFDDDRDEEWQPPKRSVLDDSDEDDDDPVDIPDRNLFKDFSL